MMIQFRSGYETMDYMILIINEGLKGSMNYQKRKEPMHGC